MGIILVDGRFAVTEDRFAKRAIGFYDSALADRCVLRLDLGHFVIVYPTDINRPACAEPPSRKVVVKIDCSLVGG